MKSFFSMLAIASIVGGFFIPVLWVIALISIFIAIGAAPEGKRADGKARTGGLLGGMWDAAVVSSKMKKCPHCRSDIPKEASVCRHCARDIGATEEAKS